MGDAMLAWALLCSTQPLFSAQSSADELSALLLMRLWGQRAKFLFVALDRL